MNSSTPPRVDSSTWAPEESRDGAAMGRAGCESASSTLTRVQGHAHDNFSALSLGGRRDRQRAAGRLHPLAPGGQADVALGQRLAEALLVDPGAVVADGQDEVVAVDR